nr:ATP-binding protein [bacterium]
MREISLHILDIAQNSVAAGAKQIDIQVAADTAADALHIRISDDGCGMDETKVKRVVSPFTTARKTRCVGMGLPLLKMRADQSGGGLSISSRVGVGTVVEATFGLNHIDRAPMGDLPGTMVALVAGNPGIRWLLSATCDGRTFSCDTDEIKAVLGDNVALNVPKVLDWLQDYLKQGLQTIYGGVRI